MDNLFVDLYPKDLDGHPDVAKLIAAGLPWAGLIVKVSEGLVSYDDWLKVVWPAARQTDRYGDTWWRGAYHYVRFDKDPLAQVDAFMRAVDKAGGWGKGDLRVVLDVERADNPPNVTRMQIEQCVGSMSTHLQARTGRSPILYGGELLFSTGITSHMNCWKLWIARYASDLPAEVYNRIGWLLKDLLMWQYCGDGESYLGNYPKTSPIGKTDISALVISGGLDALRQDAPGDPHPNALADLISKVVRWLTGR